MREEPHTKLHLSTTNSIHCDKIILRLSNINVISKKKRHVTCIYHKFIFLVIGHI